MIHPKWGAATAKAQSRCWGDDQLDRNCTSVTASRSQNAEWAHLHAERECDAFKEWERSRAGGRGGRLRFHFHWSLSCRVLQRLVEVQEGSNCSLIMVDHFLKHLSRMSCLLLIQTNNYYYYYYYLMHFVRLLFNIFQKWKNRVQVPITLLS